MLRYQSFRRLKTNVASWNVSQCFRLGSSLALDEKKEDTADNSNVENDLFYHSREKELKPSEIVKALNQHIIGQDDAKRAVAVAIRNRWRRKRLPKDLRGEVIPKNILMVGPTGCGKTEIARRLAKLVDAPFLKVEATKYTEVGFHGKDVDSIIKDLVDVSIAMVQKKLRQKHHQEAEQMAENRILEILVGEAMAADPVSSDNWRNLYRTGQLDSRSISIEVPLSSKRGSAISSMLSDLPSELTSSLERVIRPGSRRIERRMLTVAEARPIIIEQEVEKCMENIDVNSVAIRAAEENGVVVIDEIDKICNARDYKGPDASDEGVQRDLLPLIEGSTFSTKYGNVSTDHILFIAAGAFHNVKPSDLIAELQGRLPIRVELKALTEEDLFRILTEPVNNVIRQQIELLKTEGLEVEFTTGAIRRIANLSMESNRTIENIGARRLHSIVERTVEDISFSAPDMEPGTKVVITEDTVSQRVSDMLKKSDLSRFIL